MRYRVRTTEVHLYVLSETPTNVSSMSWREHGGSRPHWTSPRLRAGAAPMTGSSRLFEASTARRLDDSGLRDAQLPADRTAGARSDLGMTWEGCRPTVRPSPLRVLCSLADVTASRAREGGARGRGASLSDGERQLFVVRRRWAAGELVIGPAGHGRAAPMMGSSRLFGKDHGALDRMPPSTAGGLAIRCAVDQRDR